MIMITNKFKKAILSAFLVIFLFTLGGCAQVSYCDIKINEDFTGKFVVKVFGEGIARRFVQDQLKGLDGYDLTPIEEEIDRLENGKPTKMDGWKIEYAWKNTDELKNALSYMLKNQNTGVIDTKASVTTPMNPILKDENSLVTVNFGKNPYDKMTVTVPGKIKVAGKVAGESISFKQGEDVKFSFETPKLLGNAVYYSIGGGIAVVVLGGCLFFWQRKNKQGVKTNE